MSKIFIISGSAGSGKNSVIDIVREKLDGNIHWAITTTSRAPRAEESEGNPYHFVSPETFQKMIANNELLEYEEVYAGFYFGMTRKEIEEALDSGQHIIWQIEYRGHRKIRKIFKDKIISIFILPPSLEIAEKRIRNRSQIDEAIIQERLELAKKEIAASKEYDYQIVNKENQLKKAGQAVLDIIEKEINA